MDYASSLLGLLPGARRTPGLRELLSKVREYLPEDQVQRINEAAEFGAAVFAIRGVCAGVGRHIAR